MTIVDAVLGKVLALAEADTRYARSFPVPAPTGVAATDTANITAAATAANTAGGGIVVLRSGAYHLNATLPIYAGVRYQGSPPVLNQTTVTTGVYLADGEWTWQSGTILIGDATFAAFEANAVDQGTSAPANLGNTQITGWGCERIAFDGFTYGIHVGAQNIMGLVWSKLDQLYFKNCSQWAVKLVNFAHLQVGQIADMLCQNGQYYGANMDSNVFQPGNSYFNELYHLNPRDGRDNRLTRGIVFEAISPTGVGAALNENEVGRLQVNGYGRTLLSVTAGFTNTSTSITVPDGTKFAVDMPVTFTTTANGVTANQCYVVKSVSGNTITIATSRSAAALTATGTSNLTLTTYGFANIEVTSSQTSAVVRACKFAHVDSEGIATTALYAENIGVGEFHMSDLPATSLIDLVARKAAQSLFVSYNNAKTDFDANSSIDFRGYRLLTSQRPQRGMWFDATTAVSTYCLGLGTGGNAAVGGDLHLRTGGAVYPTNGMLEHVFARDTSITLGTFNSGLITFNGATGQTFTLPTIVTDSVLASSNLGMRVRIHNVSANSLTIATDGTQVVNKVVGRTSYTLAAGSAVELVATKDNSGNLYWYGETKTLVT